MNNKQIHRYKELEKKFELLKQSTAEDKVAIVKWVVGLFIGTLVTLITIASVYVNILVSLQLLIIEN